MALLLDLPREIYDTLLPYLNGRAVEALRSCCSELRDLLESLEPTFRTLTLRQRPAATCRLMARHCGLWRRYFYDVRGERQLQLLALDGSRAYLVRLLGADLTKEIVRLGPAPAVCASPDGRFLAFDDGALVVLDLCTMAKQVFEPRGGVVYIYFDVSSTIVTWIAQSGFSLMLHAIDLAAAQPTVRTASLKGAPLFWHLPLHDASVAIAHVGGHVWSLNLLADPITAEPIASLPRPLFQVPQQCRDRAIFLVPMPPGRRGSALIAVPIIPRTLQEQAALLSQVHAACLSASPYQDDRVLCLFDVDKVRFQLTPDCTKVVAGGFAAAFLTELYEIDLTSRHRKPLPLDGLRPVALFVSPDSRMYLFLAFNDVELYWIVYDGASGVHRCTGSIAPTHTLVHNRIPFNSAYAHSHRQPVAPGLQLALCVRTPVPLRCCSPPTRYAGRDNTIMLQRVVRVAGSEVFHLPEPVELSDCRADTAWFA